MLTQIIESWQTKKEKGASAGAEQGYYNSTQAGQRGYRIRRGAGCSPSGPLELFIQILAAEIKRRGPPVRTMMRVLGQVTLLEQRHDLVLA
jgi:hypothetical protein